MFPYSLISTLVNSYPPRPSCHPHSSPSLSPSYTQEAETAEPTSHFKHRLLFQATASKLSPFKGKNALWLKVQK